MAMAITAAACGAGAGAGAARPLGIHPGPFLIIRVDVSLCAVFPSRRDVGSYLA